MNRIPDINDARVAELLADWLAGSDQDAENPPEGRRDREEIYAGSALKRGDDVQVYGVPEFIFRVVCAGNSESCLIIYYPPWFGDMLIPLEIGDADAASEAVTDRAPLDSNETPMPVFPPPMMEARRAVAASKKAKGGHDKHDRKQAIKAVIASLPPHQAQQLKKHLHEVGALGKDD